jgi:hypothetical protein
VIIFPPDTPDLSQAIVREMQLRFPILENPPGSNRAPEIDAMCEKWGIPLGSAWCALLTTDVWDAAGARTPPKGTGPKTHPAVADYWLTWARRYGYLHSTPIVGAAPIYGPGKQGPANHIGVCITTVTPQVMGFEGNTSEAGFSREGTLTSHKRPNAARLIGFIYPVAK